MKLSISLPDSIGQEIKTLATETERDVSWWIRRAWETARTQLLRGDDHQEKRKQKAMKMLKSLQGCLKEEFPGMDSVTLSHRAFSLKKK